SDWVLISMTWRMVRAALHWLARATAQSRAWLAPGEKSVGTSILLASLSRGESLAPVASSEDWGVLLGFVTEESSVVLNRGCPARSVVQKPVHADGISLPLSPRSVPQR